MSKPVVAMDVASVSETSLPPVLAAKTGVSEWRALGDQFDLNQFGVNLETLPPGAQSALKHWHTESDEFVYVIDGELVLATSAGEYPITQGMCVGFKAGVENAHHLLNRSDKSATFLVVGSRKAGDRVFYPDDDLQWLETESGSRKAARKDGTLY